MAYPSFINFSPEAPAPAPAPNPNTSPLAPLLKDPEEAAVDRMIADAEKEAAAGATATGETKDEAVKHAQDLVQAAPKKPRGISTPWADKGFFEKAADIGKDIMGSPQFTAVQHFTPWSDEVSAGMMNTDAPTAEEMYGPDKSLWPKDLPPEITGEEQIPDQAARKAQATSDITQPNRYAAGSRAKDTHKVLSAEKDERAARDPKAALGGGVLGGAFEAVTMAPAGAATRVHGARKVLEKAPSALRKIAEKAGVIAQDKVAGNPNFARQAATNTASIVSDQLGEGTGDVGERADQAVERFKNAPVWAQGLLGLGVLSPALGKRAAVKAAAKQKDANLRTARMVLSPEEQYKLAKNSRLKDNVIEQIGGDMREHGLHETGSLKSPTSMTVMKRAQEAREAANKVLDETETQMRAKAPPIEYESIAKELEDAANELLKTVDQAAAEPQVKFMREMAANIRSKTTKIPVHGPPKQIQPSAEAVAEHKKQMLQHTKDVNKDARTHKVEVERIKKQDDAAKARYERDKLDNLEKNVALQNAHAAKVERENTRAIKDLQAYQKRLDKYNKAIELPEKPKGKNGKPPTQAQMDKYQAAYDLAIKNKETLEIPLKPQAPVLEKPQLFGPPDRPKTLPPPDAPAPRTPPAEPEPQLEWPAPFDTGTRPYGEAQDDLRKLNDNIDRTRRGGGESAPMQEEVRATVANELLGNTEDDLAAAAARGDIDPETLARWRAAKKKYGTAATVEDPAMALMFKQYGANTKVRDLGQRALATAAFGPAGMVADPKELQRAWPGFKANQAARSAEVNRNLASATPVIAGAQRGAATAGEKKELNDSLKDQLSEAMKSGTDWFRAWFK